MGETCEKNRKYLGLYGKYIRVDENHVKGTVGVYHETSLMMEVERGKLVGRGGITMKERLLNMYGDAIIEKMYQNMADVYTSVN